MDMGNQLMAHIEGTELDRKMDEYFVHMQSRGLSDREIFQHMLGQQETAKSDDEIPFDPSMFNLDPALYSEFEKMMEQSK